MRWRTTVNGNGGLGQEQRWPLRPPTALTWSLAIHVLGLAALWSIRQSERRARGASLSLAIVSPLKT